MKKFIATNRKTGDRVFCKYEITTLGYIRVEYFLPKYGYSIIWDKKHPFTRIAGNRYSADGRKSIVTYLIHPTFYAGESFLTLIWDTIYDALDKCLTNNISIKI